MTKTKPTLKITKSFFITSPPLRRLVVARLTHPGEALMAVAGLPPLRFSRSLCYMAAMELRHAAALALVGWYLITPGVTLDSSGEHLQDDAPYSRWTIIRAYDTAESCEKARQHLTPEEVYKKMTKSPPT